MASICAVGNPLLSPQDASSSPSPPPPCAPSTDRSITFFPFVPPLFWLLCLGFYTTTSRSRSQPSVCFRTVGDLFLLPLAHLRRVTRFSEFRVLKLFPQSFDPRKRSATVGPRGRGVGCKSAASAFPQQLVAPVACQHQILVSLEHRVNKQDYI